MPHTVPACPQCGQENTYPDGSNYVCPDCAFEWPQVAEATEPNWRCQLTPASSSTNAATATLSFGPFLATAASFAATARSSAPRCSSQR